MDERRDDRDFWMSEVFRPGSQAPVLDFGGAELRVTETVQDDRGRVAEWRGVTMPGGHPAWFRVIHAD